MVGIEEYGNYETAWCPGCGNHAIIKAVKKALADLDIPPAGTAFFTGIGQAAKTPQYLNCNMFTGLHGRGLPPAQAAKMANPGLTVIAENGDGCAYGEGGNHYLAALRRNVDMTYLVHDNQIYGLTKGQASPTTARGQKTKAQPLGQPSEGFNPLAVAVALHAGFVARAFSGEIDHLADLIVQAVKHPGFSVIDILQPCVSFNKVNTFAWYKERCRKLDDSHDPADFDAAMALALEFGDTIPIGVIYTNDRPDFASLNPALGSEPLAKRKTDPAALEKIMRSYV